MPPSCCLYVLSKSCLPGLIKVRSSQRCVSHFSSTAVQIGLHAGALEAHTCNEKKVSHRPVTRPSAYQNMPSCMSPLATNANIMPTVRRAVDGGFGCAFAPATRRPATVQSTGSTDAAAGIAAWSLSKR